MVSTSINSKRSFTVSATVLNTVHCHIIFTATYVSTPLPIPLYSPQNGGLEGLIHLAESVEVESGYGLSSSLLF